VYGPACRHTHRLPGPISRSSERTTEAVGNVVCMTVFDPVAKANTLVDESMVWDTSSPVDARRGDIPVVDVSAYLATGSRGALETAAALLNDRTCHGPGNPPKYPTISYLQSQGVVQGGASERSRLMARWRNASSRIPISKQRARRQRSAHRCVREEIRLPTPDSSPVAAVGSG
jgi:hypothetical protein